MSEVFFRDLRGVVIVIDGTETTLTQHAATELSGQLQLCLTEQQAPRLVKS